MTIASALDHLTDVLANKDVAGYQTIEQSINNISDMIEDGEISLGGSISPATTDTLGGVKIGEGISVTSDGTISASGGGGSGTYTFTMWSVDSTGHMATDGDYATARASLADGRPIVPIICGWNFDQDYPLFSDLQMLSVELDVTNIKLWLSSSAGYSWSENGLEYFEL